MYLSPDKYYISELLFHTGLIYNSLPVIYLHA